MQPKSWLKSKTVWIAVIQGILGILAALIATDPNLKLVGGIAIIKTALDLAIRILTTQPIE